MMKIVCTLCPREFATLSDWKQHSEAVHGCLADFVLISEAGDIRPQVEPTPRLADESKKLLDNGWSIILYANDLGSYTAIATKTPLSDVIHQFEKRTGLQTSVLTDDFEPSAALYRLTEKVFGNIA